MKDLELFMAYKQQEEFYSYFLGYNISFDDAITILINTETIISMYVLVQILGNEDIRKNMGWNGTLDDSDKFLRTIHEENSNIYFRHIYPLLNSVLYCGKIGLQHLTNMHVKEISFGKFSQEFQLYMNRREKIFSAIQYNHGEELGGEEKSPVIKQHKTKKETQIYSQYEHGLSDW